MKHRIRPFGFPAWKKCKRRIAKKHISRFMRWRFSQFHDAPKATLINDCTGLNMLPTKMYPEYIKIGKRAKILYDILIIGATNTCSFRHCGVEPAKTYEECKKCIEDTIERARAEGDPWNTIARYSSFVLNQDGTFEYTK